ncbi:MAG: hypothetical protein JNK30_13755 [Phenylobacterium sp.]|uniref:hypothetical protein n=1 Tax=Phenylobacterium sp. TaxID=1871053 RepID=UPI001A4E2428|nr:hypothetical protein [Phenylobacterium sp.]MBL8772442.1 hypothetical protein [Phenylobacterium sp.]
MTQEHPSIQAAGSPAAPRRRSGPGALVVAGAVGACVLGVGLGLWARPTDPMGEAVGRPAPAAPPRPAALQIVVADAPAPIGPPLEVLPGDFAEAAPAPAAPVLAPHRSASGLVKVDAPIAAAPLVVTALKPPAEPAAAPRLIRPPAPSETDVDLARERLVKARAEKARLVKAKAEAAKAAETKRAEAQAAERARARKAAQLADAKAGKAEKARAARAAKAKAAEARLAAAKSAERKQARAEAATRKAAAERRLAAAAKAAKAAPAKVKADVRSASRKASVKLASVRSDAKARSVTAKPAKAKVKAPARVETAARAAPPKRRVVVPRGEGPLRVARADPCADAGRCGDARLTARERQLQQAYRNAEAAGVPASALRRQQARWQQARAAASRDAPWAVEDVYVARISELNDLTRDAREN